jgi:flagellar assembly protein FliH
VSFRPLRSVGADFRALSRRQQPFQALAVEETPEPEVQAREAEPEPAADEELHEHARKASEEGYEAGYNEGLAAAREELDGLMETSRELVHQLETTRAQLLTSSRNDVIDVLASSLEWLHMASLESDRELIVRVVDAVLEDFKGGDTITVLVNPEDHETLTAELSLGRKAWATWDLTIQPDASIAMGGCRVQAPEGTVDATVTDRLARLAEELDQLRVVDEEPIDGGTA